MIIDTHSHVNFNAFKNDADEVIKRSLDNDTWMINVGSQYSTSRRAITIAERYTEGVYAAIGLHPIHLETGSVKGKIDTEEISFETKEEVFDYEKYKELAMSSEKVVAIGEVGLDYYRCSNKEKQKEALMPQIKLAQDISLPIIFHCRNAHADLIDILKDIKIEGVVHCFTGTWQEAQQYIEKGFYIGFNGIIYKFDSEKLIQNTPLERMLLETDCPYLTPPEAGVKRNEPYFAKYVAKKIANIKNISYEQVLNITTQNAKNLFKI